MEIRPLTQVEQKYTYRQGTQVEGQTGNIGYLRGDFGGTGKEFYSTWWDLWECWKTDEFRAGLDEVINELRSHESGLLAGRKEMQDFIRRFPDSSFIGNDGTQYGFRVDNGKYAYLFRCCPIKVDYNFYCFCYVSEWLDRHMKETEKGIRFIDSHYNEKFRIPDGGKIIITTEWGEKHEMPCRYIDEYHTEIGSSIYHICEFAECMERNGSTYEPKMPEPQKAAKKKAQER